MCHWFLHETQNGSKVGRYNILLNAVISHIRKGNKTTQIRQPGLHGQRDFRLPIQSKGSVKATDFELITWLIVFEHTEGAEQSQCRNLQR